ncbi:MULTISPECIES: EVE domain-containing protein [Planktothrix]|uniref:EVE domain-containing protein n=1 Tax=Planktothrix agardhii CCAP 1459/11A TaxID=282420 RepID=A0A4P5ZJB4_PLAAG|nr:MULTISPECIES: EVE domain-containing protein [Planktothrix]GDZ96246.1 hypothetical protein PA905_47360 [Planktothrix agardhii CCAP 1459/11A]CAD5984428.1 hypothetical protein NO108_04949 [Planktothrix rubescens]CAH2575739.1 hypothetical protein PRNO82_04987 [Planktothrix rubescens]
MAYWLFQGNPKYYRVLDAIQDLEQIPWLVTRSAKEMSIGDKVMLWVSGQKAGIYAIAEIVELPKLLKEIPDKKYWIDQTRLGSKPQAMLKFTQKWLQKPLLRDELKKDPILKDLLVIRAPSATNFKVTLQEWERVKSLKLIEN